MNPSTTNRTATKWFWALCILQIFFWTLLPTLVRYVLPIDANEGFVWGSHFELGYDRNPWMNAVITHWAVLWGGKTGWLVYGFSQIFVCMAYWSVFQLGKRLFNPLLAVISVFMLIGIQYYSIAAVDLNDNVIDLGLWPLMVYFGYEAFRTDKFWYWLLAGIAAGLAMMTKYYSIIPVACLFAFFIIDKQGRQSFKRPGIYICTLIAFLICLPHLLWLPSHHWITVTYAQGKVHMVKHKGWMNHIVYALHFAGAQIGTFMGAVVLFLMLAFRLPTKNNKNNKMRAKGKMHPSLENSLPRGNHNERNVNFADLSEGRKSDCERMEICSEHQAQPRSKRSQKINVSFLSAQRKFLITNALGPFFITLLISIVFGWKLNTLWGTPLLSLWPLLIFMYFTPVITPKRLKVFFAACLVVFFLLLAGYTISKTKIGSHSSANVPGRAFSAYVNNLWQKRYHSKLQYVAGNRYLGGYVAYFANHPISVFIGWDPIISTWINPKAFRQAGGVFLQLENDGNHFPTNVLKSYPKLKVIGIKHFAYHRSKNGKPSLDVLVGVLPPAKP